MFTNEQADQYLAATESIAFAVIDQTVIRISGDDRKSFLHNFCTADIKGLESGHSSEAFILNTKGKILAHVIVLQQADSILLTTVSGQFDEIHDHLDKYIIREDVTITDESDSTCSVFVCGNQANEFVAAWGVTLDKNRFDTFSLTDATPAHVEAVVTRCEIAGWGYLFMAAHPGPLLEWFSGSSIPEIEAMVFETVRIENQTPRFGSDISVDNLPQELLRDDIAISFTKGCYLGQETVARIDSLGSVNKVIALLNFSSKPTVGLEITRDDKKCGKITSFCWSPKHDGWIGLGYVRRLMAKPDEQFDFESGTAKVFTA